MSSKINKVLVSQIMRRIAMWIKTQDGEEIINSNLYHSIFLNVRENGVVDINVMYEPDDYNKYSMLGRYKDFDCAKKVFENIFDAMANGQEVFIMPEDIFEENDIDGIKKNACESCGCNNGEVGTVHSLRVAI